MYHTIVKRLVRNSFQQVNNHEYDTVLSALAPNVRHRFAGEHALGGERNDTTALKQWFLRLGRVLPNLHIEVTDVWVKGWPNDTTAIARWNACATLANGSPYHNQGIHVIKLKRGKVQSLDVVEDSQAVANALCVQAANGITEAASAPVLS